MLAQTSPNQNLAVNSWLSRPEHISGIDKPKQEVYTGSQAGEDLSVCLYFLFQTWSAILKYDKGICVTGQGRAISFYQTKEIFPGFDRSNF